MTPQTRSAAQFEGKGQTYAASAGHANRNALQSLVDLVGPTGSEALLDIATGGGHVANAFGPHVKSVVALDLVSDMLAQAAKGGAFPVRGMAERYPFASSSFDLVTCRLAAHHFADIDAFLGESHRVLRPGGRLLIVDVTVPEDRDTADEINRIEILRDPSHGRNLPVSEWKSRVEDAGFDVESTTVSPFGDGLRMEFEEWTRRIGTPSENIQQLRTAFENASSELRNALRIQAEGDTFTFELDEVILLARRTD